MSSKVTLLLTPRHGIAGGPDEREKHGDACQVMADGLGVGRDRGECVVECVIE
jgi:hypothetical protein